jgi:fructosamine-3-kinase
MIAQEIVDSLTRLDLYNLYPLLVHLNLFGSSYLGEIMTILKRS